MALVHADRVKETSTTTGTGTYSLAGAETGFQGFVAGIGSTNTCYYCAEDGTDWEVGIGTVTDATPDTLARTTVLKSSNADAAVNWGAGTKNIFATIPAEKFSEGVWEFVSSVTLSSQATVEFTGLGGDWVYRFIMSNILPATDGARLWMRTSTDGGSTYDSGASDYGQAGAAPTAQFELCGATYGVGSAANEGVHALIIDIVDAATAKYTGFAGLVSFYEQAVVSNVIGLNLGGARLSAGDVDAIRFLFSTGNLVSGTIKLYKMAAS